MIKNDLLTDNGYQLVTDVNHHTVLVVFTGVSMFELALTGLLTEEDTCDVRNHINVTPSSIGLLLLKTNIFFVISLILYLVIVLKSVAGGSQMRHNIATSFRRSMHSANPNSPRLSQTVASHGTNMMLESLCGLAFCVGRVAKPVVEYYTQWTVMHDVTVYIVFLSQFVYARVFRFPFRFEGDIALNHID